MGGDLRSVSVASLEQNCHCAGHAVVHYLSVPPIDPYAVTATPFLHRFQHSKAGNERHFNSSNQIMSHPVIQHVSKWVREWLTHTIHTTSSTAAPVAPLHCFPVNGRHPRMVLQLVHCHLSSRAVFQGSLPGAEASTAVPPKSNSSWGIRREQVHV